MASLDLDALHLYFHSPECQRLYGWLVDYPSEIVPLMDILLGRELETLRDELRLRHEEKLAEAEADGVTWARRRPRGYWNSCRTTSCRACRSVPSTCAACPT